jgi:hypothetical protein
MRKWQKEFIGEAVLDRVEESLAPQKCAEKPTALGILKQTKEWIENWSREEFTVAVFVLSFILLLAFKPFLIQRPSKKQWETETNYFLAFILSALIAFGYYVALVGGL